MDRRIHVNVENHLQAMGSSRREDRVKNQEVVLACVWGRRPTGLAEPLASEMRGRGIKHDFQVWA